MMLTTMKWNAVQSAKATLPDVYWHYCANATNDWMKEEWGDDIFQPLREVPDFTLAPLFSMSDGTKVPRGEVDLENCIRVYDGLRGKISEAEASMESLWAGLCNDNFYGYMRERWGYSADIRPETVSVGAMEARFFFGTRGSGPLRNTLAKCWWIAHLLYDAGHATDPYWRLRALGAGSFSTKVTDIFVNYGFTRNRRVLAGVVLGIQRCREQGITIDNAMTYLRPALQHLNAVGGLVLLDLLPEEEIADILVEGARLTDRRLFPVDSTEDDEEEEEEYDARFGRLILPANGAGDVAGWA